MFKELDPRFSDSMGPSKAFFKGLPRRVFKKGLRQEKVFVIGFHKTGTSSLGKALQILGYDVCGSLRSAYPVEHSYEKVLAEAKKMARFYDAFQDTPWFLFYKEMHELYPNAKFILTVRDDERWLKSALNHFGDEHKQWKFHKLIYGNAKQEEMVDRYRQHIENVRAFFKNKPDSFIEINLKQENSFWEKLCGFLNAREPSFYFPHVNKSKG